MSGGLEAVRVKVIVTRFVETDPICFKSVVQDLTGRHSTIADREEEEGKGEMQMQYGGRLRMPARKVEEGRGGGGPPRGVTTVGDLLRLAEQQLPFEELFR